MKIARNILLIVLALFLQTSWIEALAIWDLKPDMVVLVIVLAGITSGQIEATLLGFFSGFLLDIYAPPEWMGLNALAYSLVGFAVGYSRVGVVAEDVQVQAAIFFLSSLLHNVIYFVIYAISDPLNIGFLLIRYGLGTAIYTALVGLGLSLAFARFFNVRIEPNA